MYMYTIDLGLELKTLSISERISYLVNLKINQAISKLSSLLTETSKSPEQLEQANLCTEVQRKPLTVTFWVWEIKRGNNNFMPGRLKHLSWVMFF
jgi:hypothetical protein